ARAPWVAPALPTVLTVTTAVDVLGNLLVILSVLRNLTHLRNGGNLLVVSLALADLALYPYPLILAAVIYDGWVLGEVRCKASAFVMGLSVIGSVLSITAIAINRYCCICHNPAPYHRVCTPWHAPVYIGLIWGLTLAATVPNFVGSLEYDPRIYSCTFTQTASAQYTAAAVAFGRPSPGQAAPAASDVQSRLATIAVLLVFAVCWAPLNHIGLDVAPRVPERLFVTSYFLAYFNSCLDAIIYGLLNQNFRRECKRILSTLRSPGRCFKGASSSSYVDMPQNPGLPAACPCLVLEGAL
uniref:Melatonin receptor 1B n=1 Tax=Nannospalax galili TaxID=1026970 RepID=A0A8C6QXM2_NANGA